MHLSPDEIIFWQYGFIKLNATIAATWAVMAVLVIGSRLITRSLDNPGKCPRWRNLLEVIVLNIVRQIEEIGLKEARKYMAFIGSIFLFLFFSNLCTVLPFYEPPTGSLSTTGALAVSVFAAVPFFGISSQGFRNYMRAYLKPTPLMLPFHVIGEFTRTLALAVRLFGNMMSGAMILAILISITPLLFPIFMSALGLLIGSVQAYIFSVLAAVFIAAATQE